MRQASDLDLSNLDLQNLTLVLLPGLDGTGQMFQPLLNVLPNDMKVKVVKYSPTDLLTYADLVEFVSQDLASHGDVVLLGESFSGPIALELLASGIETIKGAVFCATFAESPRPWLLRCATLLPLSWLLKIPLPTVVIRLFGLGLEAGNELILMLRNVLTVVPPKTIAYRLRLLNKLKFQNQQIQVPCCYIQATRDRLVPVRSLQQLHRLIPNLQVEQVQGPHFILQTNPEACADVIIRYVKYLQQPNQ